MTISSKALSASTHLVTTSHLAPAKNAPVARVEDVSRFVMRGRILFVVTLSCVAGVFGFSAFYFLTEAETNLAETEFTATAHRALDSASLSIRRQRSGVKSMASILSHANPRVQDWPEVALPGFEETANALIETSDGREMKFAPIVKPDELTDFETFAYRYFQADREPPFPSGTAVSSFGRGVFGEDPMLNTTDHRYHMTPDTLRHKHDIIVPILQHNQGAHPLLLYDLYSCESRSNAIDDIISCSDQLDDMEPKSGTCAVVTEMMAIDDDDHDDVLRIEARMIQPIYHARMRTRLAGFIFTVIDWRDVLQFSFAPGTCGIDCVLETEGQVYTYAIKGGKVSLIGSGDRHSRKYSKYAETSRLVHDGFADVSAHYKLTLYPRSEYFEIYSTRNPRAAAIGAVAIIVLISLLFFLYDFYVRREFNVRKGLLEAKRKFVRFVSHEVRTPLNSVCMGLSVLREEMQHNLTAGASATSCSEEHSKRRMPDTGTEWLKLTEEILFSAQTSVDVLNDLLNYDKIEMGKLCLDPKLVDVVDLVERIVHEFILPASTKNIEILIETPCTGDIFCDPEFFASKGRLGDSRLKKKVVGDEVRISQVIRNLLSNAIKFSDEDGRVVVKMDYNAREKSRRWSAGTPEDPSIIAEFCEKNQQDGGYERCGVLEVSVSDSGAGLSDSQLKNLFQDGIQFNVNELQAGQGSGLGLFISKGIIEQHGGTVRASSKGLGKGTKFTVSFPLYEFPELTTKASDVEATATDSDPKSASDTDNICSALSILVVDDSKTNRKLLCRLLENQGHICVEAEDGRIAVEMTKDAISKGQPFDTILLDFEMPVMNGPTAAKEIRALGFDTFIVGVTGNLLHEDVEFFTENGANDVLPKPFKYDKLVAFWESQGIGSCSRRRLSLKQDCAALLH